MPPKRPDVLRIGVDLDNTVIDYGTAYSTFAPMFGVTVADATRSDVRNALRRSPLDDEEWQHFQSVLYTDGLDLAKPAAGVFSFLDVCSEHRISVLFVSHKTKLGPERFGGRSLRTPVLAWLGAHRLVPEHVSKDKIYFAETLYEKIQLINSLKVDVFIDDLIEVLSHTSWPKRTLGIHYAATNWTLHNELWSADFPTLARWVES